MAKVLGALVLQLQIEQRRLARDLDKANKRIDRSTKKMERSIGRAGKAFKKLAGPLIAVASVAGFRRIVSDLSILQTTSEKLGRSAESLQSWRFAADQVNIGQSALDQGLQRFSRRLAEAANGQGELTAILEQYNIAVRDSAGNTREVDDVLDDYADAIQSATTEQEKLRLAFKGFDSEGAAMVNILREGSDGLDVFKQQASDAGAIISNELVAAAAEFDRLIKTISATIKSQFVSAVGNLALAIKGAFDDAILFDFGVGLEDNRKKAEELREEIEKMTSGGGSTARSGFQRLLSRLETLEGRDPALVIRRTRKELVELDKQLAAANVAATNTKSPGRFGGGAQRLTANKNIQQLTADIERLNDVIVDAEKALEGLDPSAKPKKNTQAGATVLTATEKAAATASASAITGLEEQLALSKAITDEEKFRVSLTQGVFKNLVDADRQRGASLANQIKANEAIAAQRQLAIEAEQARVDLAANVIADLEKQVRAYTQITEAAKIRFELEEGAYKGLDGVSKARIDDLARELEGLEKAAEAAKKLEKQQEDAASKSADAARQFGLTFSSAFEDAIVQGSKFSDVLKGIEQDLIRFAARKFVTEPLAELFSGGSDGSGGVGKFFAGLFAGGGYIPPGKFGIVGENGPELAFGGSGGKSISPGGGVSVTIINNSSAQVQAPRVSEIDGERRIQLTIENSVAQGVASGSMKPLGLAPGLSKR